MARASRILLITAVALVLAGAGESLMPAKQNVSIKDMSFSPASVEVHVDDTVTWTNSDDRDHTVVADDGSFNSGNLPSGRRFSFKFGKAGKFTYACSYHPRMKGTVTVVE